jgi:hypothetical protein
LGKLKQQILWVAQEFPLEGSWMFFPLQPRLAMYPMEELKIFSFPIWSATTFRFLFNFDPAGPPPSIGGVLQTSSQCRLRKDGVEFHLQSMLLGVF